MNGQAEREAAGSSAPAPGAAAQDAVAAHALGGRSMRQFVKFSLVGGSGVLVNLAVFNLTMLVWHAAAGENPLAAKYAANGFGFVVSVLTNYYLNRRWTFRSRGLVRQELPKFFTVSIAAYLANLAVFSVSLTQLHISPNVSQLIAIACVMPINFLLNKLWSFRGT